MKNNEKFSEPPKPNRKTLSASEEKMQHFGQKRFFYIVAGGDQKASGKGMEHMASFDYGYKLAAVRDWLFRQCK